MSIATLFIIFLTTCAAAQTNGLDAGFIPNGTDVPLPPAEAPKKIDPSKVKFLLGGVCDEKMFLNSPSQARGIVDRSLDLSDDLTARQLLQMGIKFVLEKCPEAKYPFVLLRSGDPVAFTNPENGFGFLKRNVYSYPLDLVEGGLRPEKPGLIVGYENWPQALKNQQAYYAEKERQREAELQQQRQAEQKAAARWTAFLQKYGVKHVVNVDELTANPFVYKGQVVATGGTFERMNSPTQGIFSARGRQFVVSGISTTRFTRTGSVVILAGRVLGHIEVKPGPTVVPHLSFVAIYVAN
jgi:hypothetical protein